MRQFINYLIILLLGVTFLGCDQLSQYFPNQKSEEVVQPVEPVIPKVNDTELAKLILQPKQYKLTVTRDPFLPLIQKDNMIPLEEMKESDVLKDMEYLGVVEISAKYSALLQTTKEKGVYGLNDVINQLTITDIQPDFVVLKNGVKSYTLKRGGGK